MPETRDLAYKDRFVRYLIQTLSDRFDTLTTNTPLPFVDQLSRVPLVYRVNQTEFTQILSAIMTGGDLAFPDIAHELELIWANPDDYGVSEDFCLDYETADSTMITYFPMNPFTEPETVPDGYLMPPFWVFGDILPEFIGGLFDDLLEEITGYLPTDVLSTIGSFPLFAGWDEIVGAELPRIDVAVDGKGVLELHLLSVPFGGRALITLDTIPSLVDIVAGLWLESDWLVDLERDYTSIPPESLEEMIVEFPIETTGAHTVYVTMLPVVNDSLVPLSFGGGIRKITWCPDEIPDEPPTECDIPTMLQDDEFFETEYVPAVFGEFFTETVTREAANEALYDTTPQSIGASIPTGTPNSIERNALCAAINRYVALYCSTKLCLIQSKNFLEVFWTKMAAAANEFYEVASNLMSPIYSANISSCFVTDADAITALQDTAAMEEIACFIYDELKTVVIDEADFNTAVLDASTTLTGTAQDVACLMLLDNNVSIYISFLEAYNIALTQQSTGSADVDCPCETDTYWMLVQDFEQGQHGWFPEGGAAIYSGDKWTSKASPSGASVRIIKNLDLPYVLKAAAMLSYNDGFTSQGGDAARFSGRVEQYAAGNETLLGNSGFRNTNLSLLYNEGISLANIITSQSLVVRNDNVGTTSGTNYSEIRKVVYYGLPNGSNKPSGSVWTDVIPSSGNLFP